jgi:hypothetical protein
LIPLSDIHRLTSSDELASLVMGHGGRHASAGTFCLGIAVGDRRFFVNIESGKVIAGDESHSVQLGCLAKLLTATIVTHVMGTPESWGARLLDMPGAEVLSRSGHLLRDIAPSHLLNHTHGLDASLANSVPRKPGTEIDVDSLLGDIEYCGEIARPGEIYSYSSVGAWLWAVLLEQKTGRDFSSLIRQYIAEPCGMTSYERLNGFVCSAGLVSHHISVGDLLRFCQLHANSNAPDRPLSALRAPKIGLPGWTSGERAVCQAWKFFGDGWYGHNALLTAYTALVRIHPESQTSLVICGDSSGVFTRSARLFARILPELARFRPPRHLSQTEANDLNLDPYPGVYRNASLEIGVSRSDDGQLHFKTKNNYRDGGWRHNPGAALIPARQHVFFSRDLAVNELSFLQFVQPRAGRFDFAWNGVNVFRRDP